MNNNILYMKKYKLINVKMIGGTNIIPIENITYSDDRNPHEIEMYKKMFQIFLGLAPKLLKNNFLPNKNTIPNPEEIIKTSSIHRSFCNTENICEINICGNKKVIPIIKKDVIFFTNSLKSNCYTPGCQNNVFLLHLFTFQTPIFI